MNTYYHNYNIIVGQIDLFSTNFFFLYITIYSTDDLINSKRKIPIWKLCFLSAVRRPTTTTSRWSREQRSLDRSLPTTQSASWPVTGLTGLMWTGNTRMMQPKRIIFSCWRWFETRYFFTVYVFHQWMFLLFPGKQTQFLCSRFKLA